MKHKIIYLFFFSLCILGNLDAQFECSNTLSVELNANGEAQILATDLVPNVEFYIANGTVTYYVVPFNSGVFTSGIDVINIDCSSAWSGVYIVEYTVDGELIESCNGTIEITDPSGACPNYNYCEEASLDCKKAVGGYSYYSTTAYSVSAENFAICSESLDCQGEYGIAIGSIQDAENLTYTSEISSDNIVDYVTPMVLSYTEGGVTEYDNTLFYAWQNLECVLIPKVSLTVEMDLTAEFTIVPSMFLQDENTCTDLTLAITEINGPIPTDFYDDISLDCEDLGYHTVYLKDNETGMISSSQLFVADPLEVCGVVLGPGDRLIKMANDPPSGTYANTKVSVNGTLLPTSPTGKGWIINENDLVEGQNTLDFDSKPFSLNGMTTLDLVLLQRLIILDIYEKPMESIVMDIDLSGYNGIGDLVLCRAIILGVENPTYLPNVLFKPEEFEFPSDFNPFDFDYDFTKYTFDSAEFEDLSFRFEGYKLGDFNDNAATEDGLLDDFESSTRDLDVFEVSNMEIEAGVPFTFDLSYSSSNFKGLLIGLVSNAITFEDLSSDPSTGVDFNILNGNEIRISYLNQNVESIEDISFQISGVSAQSGDLIDFLGLKPDFPNEVIDDNDEVIVIDDLEEENVTSIIDNQPVEELSIFPNPVEQDLIVEIENGVLGKVEILDLLGQRVQSKYSPSNSVKFDVSGLDKGLYIIRTGGDFTSSSTTFMKK